MNLNAVLTRRESQIAEYLAWGCCKKEIASLLFISVRTVENICRSIYDKTDVTKVNELSAWYFCTHFNIPLNLSPIARRIGAIIILLILIPCAFDMQKLFAIRSMTSRTTVRYAHSVRARRMYENDYYSNLFKYEN
jgi:DNA-binding CsgD family transcriptional regulator